MRYLYLVLLIVLVGCETQEVEEIKVAPDYEFLWTDGTINYYFKDGFPEEVKLVVREGVRRLNTKTNINIVEYSDKGSIPTENYSSIDYHPFVNGVDSIGMQPGENRMYFQHIEEPFIAVHEFGHELGLEHEQNNINRDNNIIIIWENIYDTDRSRKQFKKAPYDYMGNEVDTLSIMIYGSYKLSKNGKPTATTLEGKTWGTQKVLSKGDIETINYLYPYAD